MIRKIILIILSTIASITSHAQLSEKECVPIDIRDKNPGLANFFSKPRNQDSIGWCYAFAAADLMSAEVGVPVSAYHTSAIYNKGIANSFFRKIFFGKDNGSHDPTLAFKEVYEGGFIDTAIKDVKKEGEICSEEAMPFDKNYRGQTLQIVQYIEELKSNLKDPLLSDEQKCQDLRFIFPNLITSEFQTLYQALLKDDLNKELATIIAESCPKNKLKIPNFKIINIRPPMYNSDIDMDAEKNKFFKKVGDILDSGKPLGISYNVRFVTNKEGMHASVVTARRWYNNKCEFKIRNSWGQSCAPYKNEIECNRSEGSYWVDENKFYDMVDDITYISK